MSATMTSTVHPAGKRSRSLVQQAIGIAGTFPGRRPTVARGKLRWVGELQPSPLSETYKVRIEYTLNKRPVIQVLEPKLESPPGEPLPHTFEGDTLCVYYPGEWSGDLAIEVTIIPWVSEWLLYYELWLVTGKWLGGGHREQSDQRNA